MLQITIPSNRVSLGRFNGPRDIIDTPNGALSLKGPALMYFDLVYSASNPDKFKNGDFVHVRIIEVEVPNAEGFINKHAFGNTWSSEKSRTRRKGGEISGWFIVESINNKVVSMTSSGMITIFTSM